MKKCIKLFVLGCSFITLFACGNNSQSGGGNNIFSNPFVEELKLYDQARCNDCKIKMWSGESPSASYYITPQGFELEKLAKKNYYMEIKVSYNVHYTKDYSALWDIGYAGSPKYEASIKNSDDLGVFENNMPTTLEKKSHSFSYKSTCTDLINNRIILTFSTDNIQNTIYFDNILVTYTCY